MFDTHCHLNFKAFEGKVEEVIKKAKAKGVNYFLVPGTDLENSKKAIEIAQKHEGVFAAIGVHPHHVHSFLKLNSLRSPAHSYAVAGGLPACDLEEIERLLKYEKVVAVGETGLDYYSYQKTKYENYQVNSEFTELQKELFIEQMKLAIKYKKSLVLHNREATEDFLKIIDKPAIAKALAGKVVFHCCEPDDRLLEFAKKHQIFIGVDGDVTYKKSKQEFVKKIPLELLVLETDSPFLLLEPLRSQKYRQANEPQNLVIIADFIAGILGIEKAELIDKTFKNSQRLFNI